MSIGVLVVMAMIVVGVLWTAVLLIVELVRGIRQRRRIEVIARRIDELLGEAPLPSGRHRLRSGHV